MSRAKRHRTDAEILASPSTLELLRAVAAGEVVRGEDGQSAALMAPYYWHGEAMRLDLVGLRDSDLIRMPISGPPRLEPRGERLLREAGLG